MKNIFIVLLILFGISQAVGQSKEAHIRMGKTKMGMLEYQLALAHFQAAIDIDADHGEAYYWRGRMRIILGDFEMAGVDFRKAMKLDPAFMLAQRTKNDRRLRLVESDMPLSPVIDERIKDKLEIL